MNFLKNLEQLMEASKMSRGDIAKACGISYSAICSWWNRGYENVSMQTLLKLSKCFNCSLEELVHGAPEKVLVYSSNEFSESELKQISIYANYLKTLRTGGDTDGI